ncbi:MAG: M3 family metallopeptidase [Bacteroidetes bacterium]|nr:M3 family metallopeptidase [Bacteroidota bacterium]
MKKIYLLLFLSGILMISCQTDKTVRMETNNPFFEKYDTPFNVPDFGQIKNAHFMPAFEKGIEEHTKEIGTIVDNTEEPSFDNTVVALEESGALLTKVSNVFYNLLSSVTNDTLQYLAKEAAPKLSKHRDDIVLNATLFSRIKSVYDNRDANELNIEQAKLLDEVYKKFVRGGANLGEKDQEKLRKINEELSLLSLSFGDNLLAETNAFTLVIDNEEDLAGLSGHVIASAAETAVQKEMEGKWVFTLQKPSMIPFLQYSQKKDLREIIFKAYINRGNRGNEYDNKKILTKTATLRLERARLLGYKNHADYVLEENMAKEPRKVYDFLNKIWNAALPVANKEADELQKIMDAEGENAQLHPWDWWYYAEKLRQQKYELDEEMLRPYFVLENVREGVFYVADRLFGLKIEERTDIPKYHEDVQVYEVKEADGSHIGILYMDFFPRDSKKGGAWMSTYRKQYRRDGEEITPVITTNFNFTKPTGDKPALLNFEEVSTLYHEFGHALHGLLSDCYYRSLSGTSVPRDFVELPSQIMENWAAEPEVMKVYAKHYETGEVIPKELIDKLKKSKHFNQGFASVEYLSASFLDMDWHTIEKTTEINVLDFEDKSSENIKMIPEIIVRYRSTYFAHIFSGGYSSGYYSYIWAEVLDADAFNAFKETGLFDQETAARFRENILERGGTRDPMELYKMFRGAEPSLEPMLERKGLI